MVDEDSFRDWFDALYYRVLDQIPHYPFNELESRVERLEKTLEELSQRAPGKLFERVKQLEGRIIYIENKDRERRAALIEKGKDKL